MAKRKEPSLNQIFDAIQAAAPAWKRERLRRVAAGLPEYPTAMEQLHVDALREDQLRTRAIIDAIDPLDDPIVPEYRKGQIREQRRRVAAGLPKFEPRARKAAKKAKG